MQIYKEVIEQGVWFLTPQSSNITRLRYLKEQKKLIIQFKQGTYYVYEGIPPTLTFELVNSQSKGKFFIAQIRNAYRGVKCDQDGNILAHFPEKI